MTHPISSQNPPVAFENTILAKTPVEIWALVAKHLPRVEFWKNFVSFSLTCRGFHEIAKQIKEMPFFSPHIKVWRFNSGLYKARSSPIRQTISPIYTGLEAKFSQSFRWKKSAYTPNPCFHIHYYDQTALLHRSAFFKYDYSTNQATIIGKFDGHNSYLRLLSDGRFIFCTHHTDRFYIYDPQTQTTSEHIPQKEEAHARYEIYSILELDKELLIQLNAKYKRYPSPRKFQDTTIGTRFSLETLSFTSVDLPKIEIPTEKEKGSPYGRFPRMNPAFVFVNNSRLFHLNYFDRTHGKEAEGREFKKDPLRRHIASNEETETISDLSKKGDHLFAQIQELNALPHNNHEENKTILEHRLARLEHDLSTLYQQLLDTQTKYAHSKNLYRLNEDGTKSLIARVPYHHLSKKIFKGAEDGHNHHFLQNTNWIVNIACGKYLTVFNHQGDLLFQTPILPILEESHYSQLNLSGDHLLLWGNSHLGDPHPPLILHLPSQKWILDDTHPLSKSIHKGNFALKGGQITYMDLVDVGTPPTHLELIIMFKTENERGNPFLREARFKLDDLNNS